MHNDRMSLRAARRGGRTLVGLALVSALVLSGCSGGDEEDPQGADTESSESSEGASGATEEEPYLPVPDGVELTAQGSGLSLGDKATVAYEPRQDEVAALDVTVTRIEKASFKLFQGWKLSAETKKTTPYFVHVKLKNVGDTDLGGRPVPLYAVDGTNKLIEASTFASTFKPCPSDPLPKKFRNGDKVSDCLVYLAPDRGELTAASFRPTEDFDPITWTGKITRPKALQPDKSKKGKKGKKGGKKKN